eukprot:3939166-Rhodomonas_salina.1
MVYVMIITTWQRLTLQHDSDGRIGKDALAAGEVQPPCDGRKHCLPVYAPRGAALDTDITEGHLLSTTAQHYFQ